LHLDEVDALPADVQARVRRAIEAQEVVPQGGRVPVRLDVRVVASVRGEVAALVGAGRLAAELYELLADAVVRVPGLAERREDLPALVAMLVRRHNAVLKRRYRGVDEAALAELAAWPWPGNLCELSAALAQAMSVGDGEWVHVEDVPRRLSAGQAALLAPADDDLRAAVRAFERMHIESVLRRLAGNKRTAASRLGVSLSSLYRKLEELGIPLS
ncbi:MAG: sigma-54-dependent Fis family transcriptional regulator, partial [bacterium]|nr:sigma-54-dependent Fis family transcriptional regulator [bacterium]